VEDGSQAPRSKRGSEGRTSHSTIRRISNVVAVPRIELIVERDGGGAAGSSQIVEGEEIRLGSHPSNDVVLEDPLVSRFHCRIVRTESSWSVVDSGSMNGTFMNGLRVRDADLPARECRIGLGDSIVMVRTLASAALVEIPAEPTFGDLCGGSLVMRQLFGMLARVAASEVTVLLEGESGTGKELVASEIVRRGARAERPFAIIDCSAISPNLMESEMFGHARGAFTGAERMRVGVFEAANGGTVLLDEIGELPLEMQSRLLRVLEAGEVRRVGENETRKIDVRVIAATNRRLDQEVNRGRFREDLYFRLSVVALRLPPHRRRLDDLELLVRVLLTSMNADASLDLFTPDVFAHLRQYDWPGNVRELRNYVERTVILGSAAVPGDRGSSSAPPPEAENRSTDETEIDLGVPLRVAKEQLVASFERRYLTALLAAADGNVSRAARQAKVDRMHLYRLLQRYGLRTGLDK